MNIKKAVHENHPLVSCILARIDSVSACGSSASGPIDTLLLTVSSPGKSDLPIALSTDGAKNLLAMLLAAKQSAPELFE